MIWSSMSYSGGTPWEVLQTTLGSHLLGKFFTLTRRLKNDLNQTISFSDDAYPLGMIGAHQDVLVITAKVGTNTIRKILIDNGSLVDILYHYAFS